MKKLTTELRAAKGLQKKLGMADNVLFCEVCTIEILSIYHLCKRCYEKRLVNDEPACFFCTRCAQKHKCTTCTARYKFLPSDLKKLSRRQERMTHVGVAGAPVQALQWLGMNKDEAIEVYVSEFNGRDQLPAKENSTEKALAKWRRLREECKVAGKCAVLPDVVPKKRLNMDR